VLLSGGLDSRLLLGLLCRADTPIQTLTFGIPGCDDARVAAEVAAAVGSRHHFFELKPDWLAARADEAVRATDGLGNIVNLHVLATLEQQSRHAQVLYKGFLGDALLGFALKRQMWADYEPGVGYEVHRGVHREQGVLNYDRNEQQHLFTDAFQATVRDAPFEEYRAGMERAGTKQLANQRLFFDLTQRVPRMTLNGVEVARQRAVVRLPFCDNDLLDFALTVPPGFLFDRYLPKVAFAKHFPRLAQIPIAGGRPLRSCARDVLLQARSLLAWHLQRYRLERLAGVERRPYKDYDGWFRTLLRPWVEGILLQPRTLERGYFRPEYVRQLVAAHMGGAQHAVRLGAMLTIELWHRQFVD
jgi:asparagine synthetase B (glutamine-hydrolysing)